MPRTSPLFLLRSASWVPCLAVRLVRGPLPPSWFVLLLSLIDRTVGCGDRTEPATTSSLLFSWNGPCLPPPSDPHPPRGEGSPLPLGSGISTPFLLLLLTRGVRIPGRPSVSVRSEKPGGDVSDPPPPSSPSLFGSNPPIRWGFGRTPSALLSLSALSSLSLWRVSLVGGRRTCISLSLFLFLSLHPSIRPSVERRRRKTKEDEGRKVESQGGNARGSIERRAGAVVDHVRDTPAWNPSEKKREEGRKIDAWNRTKRTWRDSIPQETKRRDVGLRGFAFRTQERETRSERSGTNRRTCRKGTHGGRNRRLGRTGETVVLPIPSMCARARASTCGQDETKDIRNRRASIVHRTIQDGVEIRTDAYATTGRTRNDDASETRQHVCERKRPKANVSVPTEDADDGHLRNARRPGCTSKRRRRRRCRPCRSCDPTTCGTKR